MKRSISRRSSASTPCSRAAVTCSSHGSPSVCWQTSATTQSRIFSRADSSGICAQTLWSVAALISANTGSSLLTMVSMTLLITEQLLHYDRSATSVRLQWPTMNATPPARGRNPRGQGERLREDIVSAALRMLDDLADDQALSLRAVAREVGIAATSVYIHFADRDALVLAALERCHADLIRGIT